MNPLSKALCRSLVVLLPLVLIAACGPSKQARQPAKSTQAPVSDQALIGRSADGKVRVALLVPLSGEAAELGQALSNAAQMALFDLADEDLVLLVKDTGGTEAGARRAASAALVEGAELVLGPLYSSSVTAIAPDLGRSGVAIISFSNNAAVAGRGVYLLGVSPEAQVERIVDYALRQELYRLAVFAPRTPFGEAVTRSATAAAQERGAEMVRVVSYDLNSPDLTEDVKLLADYRARQSALQQRRRELGQRGDSASQAALKQLEILDTLGDPGFDAVLVPVGGIELQTVAPLLAYYDAGPGDAQLLGTRLWDDPSLGTEPALVGGWFAAPPRSSWTLFSERYRQLYGAPPPRLASLGYDAAALAAVLWRDAQASGRAQIFNAEAITKPGGFAGVDGIFRFQSDGRSQRGLAVLELQRNRVDVREDAPTSFRPLVY
jgi:ABC-type branched-subunit amino acid transport system substrate-binding protein